MRITLDSHNMDTDDGEYLTFTRAIDAKSRHIVTTMVHFPSGEITIQSSPSCNDLGKIIELLQAIKDDQDSKPTKDKP